MIYQISDSPFIHKCQRHRGCSIPDGNLHLHGHSGHVTTQHLDIADKTLDSRAAVQGVT